MNSTIKGILLSILLVVSPLAAGERDALYLLSRDGMSLAVLREAQVVRTLDLPWAVRSLHATPGGGYLFLLGEEGQYLGLNGTTGQLERSGRFPLETVRWLTFSPTGHQLYLQDGRRVVVLDHRQGLVENPRELEIPPGGAISFNRRGTRYYRTSQGLLEYRLLKDHSRIEEVRRLGEVEHWQPDPRFSSLWGVDAQGRLIIVDEARGRVAAEPRGTFAQTPLRFFRGRTYLLADGGSAWVSLDQRHYREQRHGEAPEPLLSLHQGDGYWYFPSARTNTLWVWKGEEPGRDQGFSAVPLEFAVKEGLWLALKQGEGFACF